MSKFVVGLGGIFFVVLVILIGGKKRTPEIHPISRGDADIVLSQISFVQTRNNLKDWELTAEEAQFYEEGQTASLKNISVVMESDQGAPLTLTGDRGQMDAGGKTFSMQGGREPVTVRLNNGYTIKTNSLSWVAESRVIQTEDPVEISGQGVAISGEGMRMFLDRSEVRLMRNVHATMD